LEEGVVTYVEGQETASVKQLDQALKTVEKGAKSFLKTTNSIIAGAKNLNTIVAKIGATAAITTVVKKSLAAVTEYQRNIYKLSTLMGKGAEDAQKYAQSLQDLVGINMAEFLGYQSKFYQSASGMGIVSDKAQIMSRTLAQLSYDMAAFNGEQENVEKYASKLNEAYTGSIKALRNMGFALGEADLRAEALKEGIDVNIRTLNAASKSMLRYNAIIRQSKNLQGSYINTTMSLAGAEGVLAAQFKSLYQVIGSLIYPLAMTIMPYVIGFIKTLTILANNIAAALNIKMPVIDTKASQISMNSLEEDVEDVGKALKESFTLGIDELNVFNKAAANASGIGGTDITNLINPETYDFLAGYEGSNAQKFFEGIQEKVEQLTPLFEGLGKVLEGFAKIIKNFADEKLYPWLVDIGNWMGDHPETLKLLGEGLGLVVLALLGFKLVGSLVKLLNLVGLTTWLKKVKEAFEWCLVPMTIDGEVISKWERLGNLILKQFGFVMALYGGYLLVKGAIGLVTGTGSEIENWNRVIAGVIVTVTSLAVALGIVAGIPALISIAVAALCTFVIFNFEKIIAGLGAMLLEIDYFLTTAVTWVIEKLIGLKDFFWTGISNIFIGLAVKIPLALSSITPKIEKWILEVLKKIVDKISQTGIGKNLVDFLHLDEGLDTALKNVQKTIDVNQIVWDSATDQQMANEELLKSKTKANAEFWENWRGQYTQGLSERINQLADYKDAAEARKEADKAEWKTTDLVAKIQALLSDVKQEQKEGNKENQEKLSDLSENLKDANISGAVKEEISKLNDVINTETLEQGNQNISALLEEQNQNILDNSESELSLAQESNDWLDKLNSSVADDTVKTNSLLSAFESRVLDALAKIQHACENIKINIVNNYGNGYAGGGFPTTGEIFFANENGNPELIGKIGNRTAVMNNEQIYDGVVGAVMYAIQKSGSTQPIELTSVLELDGETIYKNQKKVEASKGFNMGGGVFAHI